MLKRSFAALSSILLHVQHAANGHDLQIPLTEEIITAMVSRAIFDLGDMEDNVVSSKIAKTSIHLNLCADGEASEDYPISGFPRGLMLEQQQKGMSLHITEEIALRKPETNPTLPARLSPRLNAGSMKRHPPVPPLDGVDTGGFSHTRSVSQPDLSIRNLIAGETEAWQSGLNITRSNPATPAPDGDHIGPNPSRLLSAKKSFAQMITTFAKSPPESLPVSASPRASTDEFRAPTGVNKEFGPTDDEFEAETERAKQESLREIQASHRQQPGDEVYVASPSHPWHKKAPEELEAMRVQFALYPSTFQSTKTVPQQLPPRARTDSTDETLQKVLEISRRDQRPMHITTPIPTIQVDERPLRTPQDELEKVLELSRIEYERQQSSSSPW
jgi:hypothetical protein